MWPESLVRELIEKRCVIRVGSGMSCQATDQDGNRPPSWPALLESLRTTTLHDDASLQLTAEFIADKRYLDAAEIIRLKGRSADFNAKIKSTFIQRDYQVSDAHKLLVSIAPKILVTTNYDTIIEGALISESGHNSFTQYEHTREGLLDALRSPTPILIKMHGCAKHPTEIVLCRSDYFKLRKKYGSFFELISAVYKLNTVLFIGCGIEDPDINLILENNQVQADTNHPSYAMVGSMSYAAKVKDTVKSQYNIDLIIYEQAHADDHSKFSQKLTELADQVELARKKFGLPS
ncbi:SIR2 family protein [Massilia sp. R2A-15]|uniref:SIR2 family NAD-dependent protein deacylase n=1 Tax=Massilia sp. R2A-15 TaxID=3064278 RepID=UPI00273297A5|nr:SIR2 family protein [Massilia sp. R2A-15]WLI89026.1 SIR2 family protein [Massilia sp. R2A-15]